MSEIYVVVGGTDEGSHWVVRAFASAEEAIRHAHAINWLVAEIKDRPESFAEACRTEAGRRLLTLDPGGDNQGPFIPVYCVTNVPFGPAVEA